MPRDARFVGPVERLLYLRSLPGFVSLGASELATIAYETRERFFKRGQRLFTEGEAARAVHFLVEGRVSVRSQGRILYHRSDSGAGFSHLWRWGFPDGNA